MSNLSVLRWSMARVLNCASTPMFAQDTINPEGVADKFARLVENPKPRGTAYDAVQFKV